MEVGPVLLPLHPPFPCQGEGVLTSPCERSLWEKAGKGQAEPGTVLAALDRHTLM